MRCKIAYNARASFLWQGAGDPFALCGANPLYRKGADGTPEIVPEEAEIILCIYSDFISGKSVSTIARELTREGIPAPAKKNLWHPKTVVSILANEKYKGAAPLQKRYTVDFLQKKTKVNEGEVPQYYVENSHPAIIEPEGWDRVQIELARRKASGKATFSNSPFSTKIFCGDCGARYTPITWHSTDKYRRLVWQCIDKFHNEVKCTTTHLTEPQMKAKFLEMFAIYFADRKATLDTLRYVQKTLTDTDFIDEDIADTEREMEILTELAELEDPPIEFDEKLWHAVVDRLTVYNDNRLVYSLKDGSEITIML